MRAIVFRLRATLVCLRMLTRIPRGDLSVGISCFADIRGTSVLFIVLATSARFREREETEKQTDNQILIFYVDE
jgi:hypothetical protein